MKYGIGIDIGATNIKGVVARSDGRILFRKETATKAGRNRAEILGDIIFIVENLKKSARLKNFKLAGIGIGIPGAISKGNLVFGGGTLEKFTGINLKKFFEKKLGLKVFAENDSQCFALAESYFGAGKNYRRVAGIIWATGIGAGFVDKYIPQISGNPYEIGHIVVESGMKSGFKCGCGQKGCVVNLASGKSIEKRYRLAGGKIKNAGVKEIYFSKEKIAKEILENAYKYLGLAISTFINVFNPNIVVIGGGVSNLPAMARKKVKKYIHQYGLKALVKNTKIVKSKLGNFAGALGAAMLILRR